MSVLSAQTPAWLLDKAEFADLLGRLQRALLAQSGLARGFAPVALAYDVRRLEQSVLAVANAAKGTDPRLTHVLATVSAQVHDPAFTSRLLALVSELSQLWRIRVTMALDPRRARVLRHMLREPGADLLGVLRREDDENAHSDVLRWLLDCNSAPAVAPIVLRSLVARLPDSDSWRSSLDDALRLRAVSVRREVTIGHDLCDAGNRDRIDLVICWPGFVLAVENKVWSTEHDGQTISYGRWLRALRRAGSNAAGFLLSPSGMPARSRDFLPLSYLELARHLLEPAARADLSPPEHQVLSGYMKTLRYRILSREFNAIAEMEDP